MYKYTCTNVYIYVVAAAKECQWKWKWKNNGIYVTAQGMLSAWGAMLHDFFFYDSFESKPFFYQAPPPLWHLPFSAPRSKAEFLFLDGQKFDGGLSHSLLCTSARSCCWRWCKLFAGAQPKGLKDIARIFSHFISFLFHFSFVFIFLCFIFIFVFYDFCSWFERFLCVGRF